MASQISIDCSSWVSMIFIWMVKVKSQNHHWSKCKIFVIRKNAKKTYLIWSRRQLAHRELLILFHKASSLKQSSHFQLKHKIYLIICSPNLALQLLTNWEKEQKQIVYMAKNYQSYYWQSLNHEQTIQASTSLRLVDFMIELRKYAKAQI